MDIGLLLARVILGLALGAHGAQKLFGWFGGYGLKGTGGFFESLGFRPGTLFALAAGLGELGGGLLTAAGLAGPVGPALMILVMLVAMVSVHWANGFFAQANGIELPLLYLTAALAIAVAGPGAYALDRAIGLGELSQPATVWLAIAGGVVLALVTLTLRRPAPAPTQSQA